MVGEHGTLEVVRADCLSSDDRYIRRFKPSPHSPTASAGKAAYSISGLKNQFEAFLSLAKAHRDDKERLLNAHRRAAADAAAAELAAAEAAAAAAAQRQQQRQQQQWERRRASHSRRAQRSSALRSSSTQLTENSRHTRRGSTGIGCFKGVQGTPGNDSAGVCASASLVDSQHTRSHAFKMHGISSAGPCSHGSEDSTATAHIDDACSSAAGADHAMVVLHRQSVQRATRDAAQRGVRDDANAAHLRDANAHIPGVAWAMHAYYSSAYAVNR